MRSKDKELISAIERFIRNFTDNAGVSPTMQEVADGVGSTKSTVQRYIVQMRKDGIKNRSRQGRKQTVHTSARPYTPKPRRNWTIRSPRPPRVLRWAYYTVFWKILI